MRLLAALTLFAAATAAHAQGLIPKPNQPNPADSEAVVTTDLGAFRFEFLPDVAPEHVAQFIRVAREGYYDGSAFFRVFANGLIQGGDPLLKDPNTQRVLWGTGGLNMLAAELSDTKHDRGIVSTVSIPNKPDSDGAQFFVCVSPQPALDGKYSAFGRVTEGMHVVEAISRVPVGPDDFTLTPVRIVRVTIEPKPKNPFADVPVADLHRTVTLKTTLGTLRIEMHPEWAPETVRNFLTLAQTGWYNGTAFHRVVKGFVAQGGTDDSRIGNADAPGAQWVHTLKGEFRDDVKHERGIVSMARGDDPDSATTSFFLMLGAAPHLDGKYSAFGKVIEGMDVLDAFDKLEVNGESPVQRIELISATVDPVSQSRN
jgi:cyclophilin family peptidyl-prolyl cis-trans isomerase